jgi:hypothetical protein
MTAPEDVAREMLRAFNESDWEAFRATLADDTVYREHGPPARRAAPTRPWPSSRRGRSRWDPATGES